MLSRYCEKWGFLIKTFMQIILNSRMLHTRNPFSCISTALFLMFMESYLMTEMSYYIILEGITKSVMGSLPRCTVPANP